MPVTEQVPYGKPTTMKMTQQGEEKLRERWKMNDVWKIINVIK